MDDVRAGGDLRAGRDERRAGVEAQSFGRHVAREQGLRGRVEAQVLGDAGGKVGERVRLVEGGDGMGEAVGCVGGVDLGAQGGMDGRVGEDGVDEGGYEGGDAVEGGGGEGDDFGAEFFGAEGRRAGSVAWWG